MGMKGRASARIKVPRIVVFEGPDGVGKTTFINGLAEYYTKHGINFKLEWFPGRDRGTLGEWVYKLHHSWKVGVDIDPVALQVLHIAAHIDNLQRKLIPWFKIGGNVILDRFWWSTYAYGRMTLDKRQAWKIVDAERQFWRGTPKPVFLYMTRTKSLKPDETDDNEFRALKRNYSEVLDYERRRGSIVKTIHNDGGTEHTMIAILEALHLG